VLITAIALLGGLTLSLTVRRRRFWVRAAPALPPTTGGRTVVTLGGLARTDRAGYGEEFGRLAAELGARGEAEPDHAMPDPAVPEESVPPEATQEPSVDAGGEEREDPDGR